MRISCGALGERGLHVGPKSGGKRRVCVEGVVQRGGGQAGDAVRRQAKGLGHEGELGRGGGAEDAEVVGVDRDLRLESMREVLSFGAA